MARKYPQSRDKNQSKPDDWKDALTLAKAANPAEEPYIPGQTVMSRHPLEETEVAQVEADPSQWPPEDAPEEGGFRPETQEGPGLYFTGHRPKEDARQEFMDLEKTYGPAAAGTMPQDAGITDGPGLANQGALGDEKTAAQIQADKLAADARKYQESESLIARRDNIANLRNALVVLKDKFNIEDPMMPAYEQEQAKLAMAKETNEANLLTAIDQQKETPYQSFWESRSTGQKIAAAIGLALGTLGGVATGGKNLAAEMIHKSIRQDARQQISKRKLAMQGDKDRFSATRRILGDAEAAVQARVVASYNKTRQKIQAHRQKVTDISQIAKLDELDIEMRNAEMAAWSKAKKAMGKDQSGINIVGPSGMMQKADKWKTVEQGGTLNYPTNPQGKPLKLAEQKVYNDSKGGFEQVQKIRKLLAEGKGPGVSKMIPSLYNHAIDQLVEFYGRMRTGAVISETEMGGFVAKNPTYASELYDQWKGSQEASDLMAGFDSGGSVRNARLDDMENYFQNFSKSLTGASFIGGGAGGTRKLKSAGKASE